jgi:hypothetical protein
MKIGGTSQINIKRFAYVDNSRDKKGKNQLFYQV